MRTPFFIRRMVWQRWSGLPFQIDTRESRAIIDRSSPWEDALATTFSPRFTIFSPRFHQSIFASVVIQLPKISSDRQNKAGNKPGTHHKSPQTPKTLFTHSRVVGPQILTLLRLRRPYFPKKARTRFPLAYSLSAAFPATIKRDARGRVAQLDRASAF